MNIYVYNCNNKNEYVKTIQLDSLKGWEGTATDVAPVQNETIGKSFAFNKDSGNWDIEIDDWRGVTLYHKNNSKVTKNGEVGVMPAEYTNIIPPDTNKQYIFENDKWVEYIQPAPEDLEKDFKVACKQFREVCATIRDFIGDSEFKGGFDEYTKLVNSDSAKRSQAKTALYATMWTGANEYCKYEGQKIGYGQPEWWYKCWEYSDEDLNNI